MSVLVIQARKSISLVTRKVRDYQMLVKIRLSLTVVFSSLLAYLIAAPQAIQWSALAVLGLGGFLVTGAANALNQVLEKDYDRLMRRTADRPLAADRMSVSEAVMAAGLMSLFGICLLALFNPWAAFFGMVALLGYAFVYTPMKRISPLAVLVGAVPGALPVLIGSVAAQGELTLLAFVLFAIQFFWQFPHFWAIGWLGYEDYQRAGYRLLPSVDGQRDRSTGLQSFFYASFLLPVVVMPYLLGVTGLASAVVVAILTVLYAGLGWNFYRKADRKAALVLMFYSFFYLPISLVVLFIDKM